MRVTRLEIFGFKSFVDRFVLTFDKDVIGIIGPNGSGKSNIVDSLRWVLGESHAKQLRGNLFDDLIFNGSESKRALGMAEVSITIRPDENWQLRPVNDDEDSESEAVVNGSDVAHSFAQIPGLFQASEVQLTRRLYRSGESEYFINRVPCRLRDMIEFYRLIGLGSRGLSIVQQGQIGEIVSRKAHERRELLEEAAGISGFRTRLEAATRQLERTSENMARLQDIISEVDKQVKVLKRQAQRAQTRHELKDSLRRADLELFARRAARIISSRSEDRILHAALNERLEQKRAQVALFSAKREEFHSAIEEQETKLSDLFQTRERLTEVVNRKRNREQELRVSLASVDAKREHIESGLVRIDGRKQVLGIEIEEDRLRISEIQGKLSAALSDEGRLETELRGLIEQSPASGESDGRTELQLTLRMRELLGRAQEVSRVIRDVREDSSKVASCCDELLQNLDELRDVLVRIESIRARERATADESRERERLIQQQVREQHALVTQSQAQMESAEQRIAQRRNELERIEKEREALLLSSNEIKVQQEAIQGELFELAAPDDAGAQVVQEAFTQLGDLERAIKGIETQRNVIRHELAAASEELERARRACEGIQSEELEVTRKLDRADIELSMLHEELERLYGRDGAIPAESELQQYIAEAEPEFQQRCGDLQAEVAKLRARLEREGEVDPQSIEQYETERARLEDMEQQLTDLQEASSTLERTIRKLKEISRARFVETFAFVSKKFSELVPRLFGGGAGTLELVNPEDPLTSGVELFVRPPGKKITNMELLSGGEKALVATAILMAMFLHRPSPICVLDEVDAPLDDANLDRFLNLIREIATNTQFLIITHNKQSMASVDRLLGITMEEAGVSKALSVTLSEVEEDLERWAANA